ncbi:MAG: hypothetical protein IH613_01775 [Desulfuromonadales bacterium]|nr:hypothetical protein [Desulfuromonadales bacterium]
MLDQISPQPFAKPTGLRLGFTRALILLGLVWLLSGANAQAATVADLPVEFGAVVFQVNHDAPTQLFIIANSHRSVVTGANGADTLQAQIETFRIGEWLIRRRQVALLLPEGFFGSWTVAEPAAISDVGFDGATLTRWLADTSGFVNAEMLLHEHYGVDLEQIEDRELYRNVRESLSAGSDAVGDLGSVIGGRLEYFQKCRSAAILQGVPAVLAHANRRGHGAPASAMLTIGLGHLGDIIEFIESGEIHIPAMRTGGADLPAVQVPLDLFKSPTGITVIVPHSLLEKLPVPPYNQT